MRRIFACASAFILCVTVARGTIPCDSVPSHSTLQIAVSGAAAVVVNAGVTEILKHSVHELRPDRSDNSSFPSRHTSWSFTASTILSNELYRYSPWWSVGAQAAASAIAYQRVASRNHYASDVIAGAAIGIASTELGYWLGRKITGAPSAWHTGGCIAEFDPNISLSSQAVYNFSDELCTAFAVDIEMRLPLSEQWGGIASLGAKVTPVKTVAEGMQPLNTLSFQIGGAGHFILPVRSLAVEPFITVGAVRNAGDTRGFDRYGFITTAGAGVQWRITSRFGFRADAAYQLFTTGTSHNAILLRLASVAFF